MMQDEWEKNPAKLHDNSINTVYLDWIELAELGNFSGKWEFSLTTLFLLHYTVQYSDCAV